MWGLTWISSSAKWIKFSFIAPEFEIPVFGLSGSTQSGEWNVICWSASFKHPANKPSVTSRQLISGMVVCALGRAVCAGVTSNQSQNTSKAIHFPTKLTRHTLQRHRSGRDHPLHVCTRARCLPLGPLAFVKHTRCLRTSEGHVAHEWKEEGGKKRLNVIAVCVRHQFYLSEHPYPDTPREPKH